jgi:hypothetical protein
VPPDEVFLLLLPQPAATIATQITTPSAMN